MEMEHVPEHVVYVFMRLIQQNIVMKMELVLIVERHNQVVVEQAVEQAVVQQNVHTQHMSKKMTIHNTGKNVLAVEKKNQEVKKTIHMEIIQI